MRNLTIAEKKKNESSHRRRASRNTTEQGVVAAASTNAPQPEPVASNRPRPSRSTRRRNSADGEPKKVVSDQMDLGGMNMNDLQRFRDCRNARQGVPRARNSFCGENDGPEIRLLPAESVGRTAGVRLSVVHLRPRSRSSYSATLSSMMADDMIYGFVRWNTARPSSPGEQVTYLEKTPPETRSLNITTLSISWSSTSEAVGVKTTRTLGKPRLYFTVTTDDASSKGAQRRFAR